MIASEKNFTSEINRIMTVISPSHVSELTDPHLIGEKGGISIVETHAPSHPLLNTAHKCTAAPSIGWNMGRVPVNANALNSKLVQH